VPLKQFVGKEKELAADIIEKLDQQEAGLLFDPFTADELHFLKAIGYIVLAKGDSKADGYDAGYNFLDMTKGHGFVSHK